MFVTASTYRYRESIAIWLCKLIIKGNTAFYVALFWDAHLWTPCYQKLRPYGVSYEVEDRSPSPQSYLTFQQQPIISKVWLHEPKKKQISGPSAEAALSRAKSFPPNLSNCKCVSKISDWCYFKPLNFRTVCYAANTYRGGGI